MATNLDRFKTDLTRLVELGQNLEYAMQYEALPDSFLEEAVKAYGTGAKEFIKKLPKFNVSYESWYSESLVLLRQLLPDRVPHFVSFYEKPKSRKSIEYGNYVIQDFLLQMRVTYGGDIKVDRSAAIPQFRQQLNIVKAAEARFESSLFEIRQLVQADLFDSELEAARELLKNKFVRAAGAISGVVLEKHLRQVCDDRGIVIGKKIAGISVLNELLKVNSVIEIPQWRNITFLADIRNLCDHNKAQEPSVSQVQDLIDGTDKVLKTVF